MFFLLFIFLSHSVCQCVLLLDGANPHTFFTVCSTQESEIECIKLAREGPGRVGEEKHLPTCIRVWCMLRCRKGKKVYEKCEKCGKLEGMGKSFRNNSQSCCCRFPSFIKMGTRIQYLMKKYSLSHSRLLRHFKTNRRQ